MEKQPLLHRGWPLLIKPLRVAIVGASGLVGEQFLKILDEQAFPMQELRLFASSRSAGKTILFQNQPLMIEELTETTFQTNAFDVALFSAGGDVSKHFAPLAKQSGALVIDNSSAWRMDPHVPLVVPEVNPEDIFLHQGIIANPNCSTIQAVVALKAVHDLFGMERITYATYQAVSGSGYKGILDLERNEKGLDSQFYPHPIQHNVIPQIDSFLDTFETGEERKMRQETKKILHLHDAFIHATCIRVPVVNGHTVVVHVQCKQPVNRDQIIANWNQDSAIVYLETPNYPTPMHVSGQDKVYIGRLVVDPSDPTFVSFITVADNIRKGAATNAIQIAQTYFSGGLR